MTKRQAKVLALQELVSMGCARAEDLFDEGEPKVAQALQDICKQLAKRCERLEVEK